MTFVYFRFVLHSSFCYRSEVSEGEKNIDTVNCDLKLDQHFVDMHASHLVYHISSRNDSCTRMGNVTDSEKNQFTFKLTERPNEKTLSEDTINNKIPSYL